MDFYADDLEATTEKNATFRTVLFTSKQSQLVVMSLLAGEEIGTEIHHGTDQFFRVESGVGQAIVNDEKIELTAGMAMVVPAGYEHNVRNTSDSEPLKLYTIYVPPEHKDGTVHETKAAALADHDDHYTT